MDPCATYDDVNLVIRLYDLRRDDRMRKARAWFATSGHFSSLAEFEERCPPGSEEMGQYWQVVSYWEMAASFVAAGVLHKELFFQNSSEMLAVWIRVEPLLGAFREAMSDPHLLGNLEAVAKDHMAWSEARSPGAYDAMQRVVGG